MGSCRKDTKAISLAGTQVLDGDGCAMGGHQTDMRVPSWPLPPLNSASTVADTLV